MTFSRSQLDRLGAKLRNSDPSLAELTELQDFVNSFEPFATDVFEKTRDSIPNGIKASITKRSTKTFASIVAKLRRQHTTLGQIQDIVGCRIVVADIAAQDHVVEALQTVHSAQVIDRRQSPSHGYRAVHLIAREGVFRFEIQVRTRLQHQWAALTEKFADKFGIEVKYGGGPEGTRRMLDTISNAIARWERLEAGLRSTDDMLSKARARGVKNTSGLEQQVQELHDSADEIVSIIVKALDLAEKALE